MTRRIAIIGAGRSAASMAQMLIEAAPDLAVDLKVYTGDDDIEELLYGQVGRVDCGQRVVFMGPAAFEILLRAGEPIPDHRLTAGHTGKQKAQWKRERAGRRN